MKSKHSDDEGVAIEMAPMIDCVFLLLIFFLVAATIRKKHNELPLQLPTHNTAAEKKKPEDDTMILSMYYGGDVGGDLSYELKSYKDSVTSSGNQQFKHTLNSLRQELDNVSQDQWIRIDADARVPYGEITKVIDLMRVRNLKRFGLRVRD